MKHLFTLVFILFSLIGFSQDDGWHYIINDDDPFEDPYRIAYCMGEEIGEAGVHLLKLEKTDDGIAFYLKTTYVCDEKVTLDLAFKVDGEWKRFEEKANVYKSEIIWISNLLSTEAYLPSLISATEVAIQINESHCDNSRLIFDNTKFGDAYKFMKGLIDEQRE